jgi:MoxR-like ATPase
MSIKQTVYKPTETYNLLKSLIESNDKIINGGGLPVSISVVGVHGIGKTTIIRELASDMGRDFFKLNLSQITEPSELVGFYSKEYEMAKKDVESIWCTENMIPDYTKLGYERTKLSKTTACPPDWVVNLKENGILCLDDFSRGNQLLMQSVMEICNEGTMIGWDLSSKKIQVILSENPDDGEYNVQSVDSAHSSRMVKMNMIWDAKDWAERAEKIGLDERLINFVLWAPELLENKKSEGISASGNVSPRMMDKFFSLVSTIDDFDKHLDVISTYGDISVGKDLTSQLINFINKKLDKLPSIDKLIKEYDVATAKSQLTLCCGDSEKDSTNWKSATAAILTTRMYNYMRYHHKTVTKDQIKQYLELLLHPSFSVDQKYLMCKQTVGLSNTFSQIIAGDPRFIKYMVK